jgi:hypothetical protein
MLRMRLFNPTRFFFLAQWREMFHLKCHLFHGWFPCLLLLLVLSDDVLHRFLLFHCFAVG